MTDLAFLLAAADVGDAAHDHVVLRMGLHLLIQPVPQLQRLVEALAAHHRVHGGQPATLHAAQIHLIVGPVRRQIHGVTTSPVLYDRVVVTIHQDGPLMQRHGLLRHLHGTSSSEDVFGQVRQKTRAQ